MAASGNELITLKQLKSLNVFSIKHTTVTASGPILGLNSIPVNEVRILKGKFLTSSTVSGDPIPSDGIPHNNVISSRVSIVGAAFPTQPDAIIAQVEIYGNEMMLFLYNNTTNTVSWNAQITTKQTYDIYWI